MSPNLVLWLASLLVIIGLLTTAAAGRQQSLVETLREHVRRRLGGDDASGEAED